MRFALISFIMFLFAFFIKEQKEPVSEPTENHFPAVQRIAFGSCNKTDLPQDLWPAIASNKPDLWIWLGDIIYADTEDMDALRSMYTHFKKSEGYGALLKGGTKVIGIYDDHDYGVNDACKYYPHKKASKQVFLDFLGVAQTAAVRKRAGAYQSYEFGEGEQKIKVIVLDCRYFRDSLVPDTTGSNRYYPNMEGDMLGNTQWQWFENELATSTANLNIICSSVQVLSNDHGYEKWGNFPNERRRFFATLSKTKVKNALILSGDRHMVDVSKINLPALNYPLYDFTSSGITHTRSTMSEVNKFREGDMIVKRNFGVLDISWDGNKPTVSMQARGAKNELYQEILVRYP